MRAALITVGDTHRLTGGYLYHARLLAELRAAGVVFEELVASDAPLASQLAQAAAFGASFDPHPFDVVVVDALARAVCGPWLDHWRAVRPLVALVHELPSVADAADDQQRLEAPLLRADLLIAVSSHGREVLLRRGVPGDRICVVSPGCDRLPRTPPPAADLPDAARSARVLCVAQWLPRKGILPLVQAWAQRPRLGAVLELIGETDAHLEYAALVREAIGAAPATAPILVRGAVSDEALAAAYRDATLFVLPSTYEGYGMVYAEALFHGLPVIACDLPPVRELLGGAGLLVPPAAPAALGAALDQLLRDGLLRSELAAAARARVGMLTTWVDTARAFQRVLEEAVARS